jgi:hypothetical protein
LPPLWGLGLVYKKGVIYVKCDICHKSIKENTEGDNHYCQGHDMFEVHANKIKKLAKKYPNHYQATASN